MDTTRGSLLLQIRDPRNAAAWEEFDSLYRPIIAGYARRQGLVDADVEDTVQFCLTRVHQHIGSFNYDPAKGRFRAWLRQIVQRHVLNHWSRRKDVHADSDVLAAAAAPGPKPDDQFNEIWLQEHLNHANELLRQRVHESTWQAFYDYVVLEQSVEEVCARHKITRNALYGIKCRLKPMHIEILSRLIGADELEGLER